MPGLSSDPKKRQNQLDALRGGQVARAKDLLASLGSAPAQPGHELGAVHTYPDEEPDAPAREAPKPRDDPKPAAAPEPAPSGGGFLAGLRDGLTI